MHTTKFFPMSVLINACKTLLALRQKPACSKLRLKVSFCAGKIKYHQQCAIQPEVRYFRTFRPLVKGNEDPGYEVELLRV